MTFVDTSALYAIMDRDDHYHGAARTAWERLLAGNEVLATSAYVVVESFALIQSRLGMGAVRLFADTVVPVLEVMWVGPDDHRAAVQAVLAADRRALSLVDCSSFLLMRRAALRAVFTFDRHFAEQGFDIVPTLQ